MYPLSTVRLTNNCKTKTLNQTSQIENYLQEEIFFKWEIQMGFRGAQNNIKIKNKFRLQ